MRKFLGKSTISISGLHSSQRRPTMSCTGGAFMGPVEVAISPGVPGQRITYAIVATGASVEPAWLPNGEPVVPEELLPAAESSASCSWLEYTGPLQIGESTTLLVRGASAGAIRQLAHEEYHFSLPQVPTADTADTADTRDVSSRSCCNTWHIERRLQQVI